MAAERASGLLVSRSWSEEEGGREGGVVVGGRKDLPAVGGGSTLPPPAPPAPPHVWIGQRHVDIVYCLLLLLLY